MAVASVTMEKLVSLAKRRGFIFPSSEIYGGVGSVWDYGPLGVELKNNVKRAWWKRVVQERDDMEGLDAAILMHPKTWIASGHVEHFHDPMVDCLSCKKRWRATDIGPAPQGGGGQPVCPDCGGKLTAPRQFNLMFKTFVGPVEDATSTVWLRPETAQGIFVNFDNVRQALRRRVPFGIAQIGKAFRNEITPGNFTFRTREFEQMEIEYFVEPGTDEAWHDRWVEERMRWYVDYGIQPEHLRLRPHGKDELAHYAKGCVDIEYLFPMGWGEVEGIANRTDFDLKRHSEESGKDLQFFDDAKQKKYFPYVIEPSAGADRATLAFFLDAYREEEVRGEKRVVLGFHPALAPLHAAVFPLLKNRPDLVERARALAAALRKKFRVTYDDTASIGRLYRRQDETGTPFCITVDVKTLDDQAVTLRNRDTMQQDRVGMGEVERFLTERLGG